MKLRTLSLLLVVTLVIAACVVPVSTPTEAPAEPAVGEPSAAPTATPEAKEELVRKALAYRLKELYAPVMITASHNPKDYNGFKMVLGGAAIHGDAIQRLRALDPTVKGLLWSAAAGMTFSVLNALMRALAQLLPHLLERAGARIGANDLLIAAVAKTHDLILVTHNTNEFRRIPGLQVEDWRE